MGSGGGFRQSFSVRDRRGFKHSGRRQFLGALVTFFAMKTTRKLFQLFCVCVALGTADTTAHAQSYSILHTFGTNVMGQYPHSTLVQGPDGILYGTASAGGVGNMGQVFKVNPDGTGYTALKDFIGSNGEFPEAGLVLSGTTLYGTTVGGGTNDSGTVFKVNTDGSGFAVLKEFSEPGDGVNPYGALVLSGSTLYGTTEDGGDFGAGTVFKVDVDGTGFAVLKHFTWYDGGHPHGTLVLSGATLYGTTIDGGSSGNGTIFKLNTDGSGFAVLRELDAWVDGGAPYAGLLLSDGVLYGMTSGGGSEGCGTLFKLKTDGTDFAVLKEFNYGEGCGLVNDLVLAGATLYGTSAHGGVSGGGTIFTIQTDGSAFSILRDFSDETDGRYPYAGFVLAGATLYATSSEGGAYGYGTLFKIESDGGGFAVLTNFIGGDGAGPAGGLAVVGTTAFGTTTGGGSSGHGTVFKINLDGSSYTQLKDFTNRLEGMEPIVTMFLDNETLYGTTASGGSNDGGTLFRLNTNGSGYTVLKHFGGSDGSPPRGRLVLSGTTLYGTTITGGSNGNGTVYRVQTDGSDYQVLKHFAGSDGSEPLAGLLMVGTNLYGTTAHGGSAWKGTLFQLNADGSGFTVLKHLGGTDGENPGAELISDGTAIFGVAAQGGAFGGGTLFKLNSDGTGFTVLKHFGGSEGWLPQTELHLSGTTLYGVTSWGGANGFGTVFQLETDGTAFAVLKHFNSWDGACPSGALTKAGTSLYGSTHNGAVADGGVLFHLAPGLPTLAVQPQSQTVGVGNTAYFVTQATGWPAPVYQWYFNNTNLLIGATSASLVLTNFQLEQVGDYTVVVSNSFGSVTSAVARLEVLVEPPFIVSQPVDCNTNFGAMVVFNILAGGTPPLAYQWLKDDDMVSDGGDISGAQTPMLTLANVVGGDAGGYSVIVSSPYGSVTSLVASLEVIIQPPFITSQPADCSTNFGAIVLFSVEADGTPPLAYHWLKDDLPLDDSGDISGAHTSALTLTNVFGGSAGGYSIVVSNVSGSVTSIVATLSVLDPFILQPPVFADWPLGQSGTLSVLAGGTPPFSYQWRKNGVNLSDATGDSIQIPVVRASSAGFYDVVASNQYSSVTSALAAVTVNLAPVDAFTYDPFMFVSHLVWELNGDMILAGNAGITHRVLRLRPDGSSDASFQPSFDGAIQALAIQSDGKIVAGGDFSSVNGQGRNRIARLNSNGTLDSSFDPGANDGVRTIVALPDGKLLIAGAFTQITGQPHTNIVRLNPDGSADDGYVAATAGGSVECMVPLPDGKVMVGGGFQSISGAPRSLIARLDSDGTLDTNFVGELNPTDRGRIHTIAIQPDGKVLLGGYFALPTETTFDSRWRVARLQPDGSWDSSFGCLVNEQVLKFALQPDGKILMGGFFTQAANLPWAYLCRLNTNGTLDPTFFPQPNGFVGVIEFLPGHRILVGGGFTQIGGQSHVCLAQLHQYEPPNPAIRPSMQTAEIGFPVGFSVRDTGFPPPEYQWTHEGVVLDGATNRSLQLTSPGIGEAGSYQVTASNIVDIATSAAVVLNMIDPVERRTVPGLILTGAPGGVLNLESTTVVDGSAVWSPLATVTLETPPDRWFDLTEPLPARCFYRAMVISGGRIPPVLQLDMIPALTLAGEVGNQIRVDGINRFGPTDAWFTLDTLTLTNTSQLYFDVTAPGQPARLYRLLLVP